MNLFKVLAMAADVWLFERRSERSRNKIRAKRERAIIEYARKNSDYYRAIIPEGATRVTDIPATTKETWLKEFDRIVTDPSIKFEDVLRQIKEHPEDASVGKDNTIVMTSGSTGTPTVLIKPNEAYMRSTVSDYFRLVEGKLPGVVLVSSAHFSIEQEQYAYAADSVLFRKTVTMLDCQESHTEIAEKMKKIRPRSLGGYTSEIRIIADVCRKNGITLPLEYIACSGENVTGVDREEIARAFPKAKVRALYACTEGNSVAYECEYGHLHINEDMVKLEPVDEDFRVLPYGEPSSQTLLTAYFSHIQPIIRYTLGDKITLHHGCPCGRKSDWVEINGRSNDLLSFDTPEGEVLVSPMNLLILMDRYYAEGLFNFRDYQIIQHGGRHLELKMDFIEPCDKEKIFGQVKEGLEEYLGSLGIRELCITLSPEPPETPESGKKKHRILKAE